MKDFLNKNFKYFKWTGFALLTVAMLYNLIHLSNQYVFTDDDFYFIDKTKLSLAEAVKKMCSEMNGRWFSDIVLYIVFKFITPKTFLLYHVFVFTSFVFSNVFLLSTLYKRWNEKLGYYELFFRGLFFSSLLYLFAFECRWEGFLWVSATGVHLLSLTLLSFILGITLKEKTTIPEKICGMFLCFCLGGASEQISLCLLFFFPVFLITGKKTTTDKKVLLLCFIALFAGTALNFYISLSTRISSEPEFRFLPAIKFFVLTFYLMLTSSFLVKLPLFMSGFLLNDNIKPTDLIPGKTGRQLLLVFTLLMCIAVFMPCYLLSDICSTRLRIFPYYLVLLFVFIYPKFNATKRE